MLIVLVMSMGFWVTCARYMAKTRARALGAYVAEMAMERAMALGFQGVDGLAGKQAYEMDVTMSGRPATYTVNYEVIVVPVDETLKSVVIRVKWDEVGGEAAYETLLSSAL